jgi:hypothetical protein
VARVMVNDHWSCHVLTVSHEVEMQFGVCHDCTLHLLSAVQIEPVQKKPNIWELGKTATHHLGQVEVGF